MTRTTNSRIAGVTYLVYIAAGIGSLALFGRATKGEGVAAKLAGIAQHATDVRGAIVLTLLTCFCAVVLGVTLYAITRVQDPDLAMLALICRVIEGVNGGLSMKGSMALLWLATTAGADAPAAEAARGLGAYLLAGGSSGISAIFFAVGSTLFCYLLWRGRMIPVPLALLGVAASALVVVGLLLQLADLTESNWFLWMPLLVFEIAFALWLLVKGAAMPPASREPVPAA